MKIKLNSIFVDNQNKALKFYAEVLGFVEKPVCLKGNLDLNMNFLLKLRPLTVYVWINYLYTYYLFNCEHNSRPCQC